MTTPESFVKTTLRTLTPGRARRLENAAVMRAEKRHLFGCLDSHRTQIQDAVGVTRDVTTNRLLCQRTWKPSKPPRVAVKSGPKDRPEDRSTAKGLDADFEPTAPAPAATLSSLPTGVLGSWVLCSHPHLCRETPDF